MEGLADGGVMSQPQPPLIYHITHVNNLPSIVADGGLWSDAQMLTRGGPDASVGMSGIKQRRLQLSVTAHAGVYVGACVPFYFCPRSVMLYLIYRGNHVDLAYKGGQGPILHLEADLQAVVAWADKAGVRWAFSLSNAGAAYTQFRTSLAQLGHVDWSAVQNPDFRDPTVKEGKQAEFLIESFFPFPLVSRIGVQSVGVGQQVRAALAGSSHQPQVDVLPSWYY